MDVLELLGRIKNTAGAVVETAGGLAKETGKKLSEKKDIARYSARIHRLNAALEEDYAQIGRLIFEEKNAPQSDPQRLEAALAGLFEEIEGKQQEISELSAKVEWLSDEKKCKACGYVSPREYSYCPQCGEKLEELQEPEEEIPVVEGVLENDEEEDTSK